MGGLTCKVRHFLVLIVSVAVTTFILSIYNQRQTKSLQNIVTQTHRQFESLKENIQGGGYTWGEKHLEVEDKYLSLLGFIRDPTGTQTTQAQKLGLVEAAQITATKGSGVIIATAVNKGVYSQYEDFLTNVQTALPSHTIVVWNIDPDTPVEEDDDFTSSLKQFCNSTMCFAKRFNFEDYPDHVKDLSFRAYRPLILQMMMDAGSCCSLWLDVDRRFITQSKLNLTQFLELAKAKTGGSNGIVGWPSGHPTSSLTHPKMFPYFETTADNFIFHRMIDPSQLLLCRTDELLNKVMKPWVACSLKKECIAPFGAQSGGCRFDKKPLYRYSGCHAYDSSALNVALGKAFPIHQPYISRAPLTKPVQLLTSNSTSSV